MKKLCVWGVALLMSLTASAAYSSMEFKTLDGTSYHINADGLVITISGEKLVMANSSNEKLELPLSSVISMQFTEFSSSISEIASAVSGKVTAFTLSGADAGHFVSVQEAWNVLSPGMYLLKDNNGKTVKIIVRK